MDNLSHSVVGLAAGELIHRSLPTEANSQHQRTRHRLLLIACWAASNFPDLDLVLTPLLPAPLGYLLHHRGHTHTLLYALPQAVLLCIAICLCWPSARRLLKESVHARSGFVASLCAGLLLHLLMDFLNSYGIHPFHPFDARWLYGDMVFIIEPVFWLAFGVPMALIVPNRLIRIFLLMLLVSAPIYFWVQGYLLLPSVAALLLLAVLVGVAQYRLGANGRRGLIVAFSFAFIFVSVQAYASMQARDFVTRTLQADDPASRVLDISLTSLPTNPLCWNFVSIDSNEAGGSYTLRRGSMSIAPQVLPVAACPARFVGLAAQASTATAITIYSQERNSLDQLRALQKENCHFDAWLRFARAPSVSAREASDIRFGIQGSTNFTTFRFEDFKQVKCSRFIPGWGYPRHDLLEEHADQPKQ